MKPNGIEWIGDIPDDWKVIRGKYTLDLLTRSTRDNDEVITCFRDGQVTLRSNRREDGFTFADKEIGYQGIRKGDLVIHGMDGFAGAIGISDSDGKGSPVLNVCRVKNKSDIRYINYYLRSLAWQNVFLAMTTGIRERSCDLRWKKIAELYFIVPPHQTQQKIADYLDEKCDEIDKTIEKQKESIEKLKTYKQSLISETVTKGLNKSTPLKPSGITWLGDIPQDWGIVKIKHIGKLIGGSGFPEEYQGINGEEIPFIKVKSLVENPISREGKDSISELTRIKLKAEKIVKGSIVFAKVGAALLLQRFRVLEFDSCIDNNMMAFVPTSINSTYFNYATSLFDFSYFVNPGTVPSINQEHVGNIKIPYPPFCTQQKIADYLNKKCEEIDSTINKKQKIIEKLDAYKKSLIFECVTGKRTI